MLLTMLCGAAAASGLALATPNTDPLVERLTLPETAWASDVQRIPIFSTTEDGAPLTMGVSPDGKIGVRQGNHTDLTPRKFARIVGDSEGIRQHNLLTAGTAVGVAGLGVLAVGGSLAAGLGVFAGMFTLTSAAMGETPNYGWEVLALIVGGTAVSVVGTSGAAALGVWWLHRTRSFNAWYTEDEARQWLDGYNERTSSIKIRPVITPGGVGLAGTF